MSAKEFVILTDQNSPKQCYDINFFLYQYLLAYFETYGQLNSIKGKKKPDGSITKNYLYKKKNC